MSLKIDRVQLEIIVQQDSAKQKMLELEGKMRDANKELKAIKRQFGENSVEYKAQQVVVRNLKTDYDKLFEEIGLGNLSMKDLGNRQRELNAILKNLNPNLPIYKKYREQLDAINLRIKELKGTANQTQLSIGKLADGFNRYAAIGASVIASLTGVALTARKCVDEFAEMQEAESQVRKYTGMTREEVSLLNEEFKRMDTRTARTTLNELAGDAGKLGITGKKDVMEFVDAANMINVALGEDLGEDAVKNIGKLAQMFGEDKTKGLRGAMLATGSAINEVAQNSSAAEAYLVGFTSRVSGTANQAKIAQGNILGYASVLDQNMQQQEMAATAFQTLMMKMYQEPAKFAKMAGQSVSDFTKLIKVDANEAILQFLEALNKKGGMSELAPMFEEMSLDGVRASGVISTMAGKIEDIRKVQTLANNAYSDGTSIIKEYNIQNNTVQAELDKAKKHFADVRIELGEQLIPVMKNVISGGSMTVKTLSAIISITSQYKGVIISAAAAVAAYTVVVNLSTWSTKAYEAVTKGAAFATQLLSKATKASPWGLVIAGVTAAVSYLTFFRKKTDETTEAQKRFNAELEDTKAAMDRIAGVKISASNLDTLNDRQKQELKANAQSEVYIIEDKMAKQTAVFRKYYSEQQRIIKARKDLDEAQRNSLLRGLDLEADKKGEDLDKLLKQKNELLAIINKIPDQKPSTGGGGYTNPDDAKDKQPWNARLQAAENAYNKELLLLKKTADDRSQTENEYQMEAIQAELEYQAKRISIIKSYQSAENSKKHAAELGKLESETHEASYETLKKAENNRLSLLQEYRDRRLDKVSQGEKEMQLQLSKQRETGDLTERDYNNRLMIIEVAAAATRLEIARGYSDDVAQMDFRNGEDKIAAIKQAGDEVLTAEKDINEKRAKITQESVAQVQKFNTQYDKTNSSASKTEQLNALKVFYESQVELAKKNGLDITQLAQVYEEEKKQIEEKGAEDRAEVVKKYSLESAEENKNLRLLALEEEHNRGLLSEEEYEAAKNKIFNDYLKQKIASTQKYVDGFNSIMSNLSSALQGFQDAEVMKTENAYDKKIAAAKKAGKDTTKLEEEKEEEVLAVKKKYADMQFALTVLQVVSTTALSAMTAYADALQLGPIGLVLAPIAAAVAIAAGAAQIAVAKQQRDQAKGLKSGGYADDYVQGYTESGNSDDVAGAIPVHKNEFVANHEAVANPHVRQFLDVFDVAQRNGSIRMINTTQILEHVRTKSGRYSGGYTEESVSSSTSNTGSDSITGESSNLAELFKLLRIIIDILRIISAKDLKVNAKDVRDEIKRLEALEKNVSRS